VKSAPTMLIDPRDPPTEADKDVIGSDVQSPCARRRSVLCACNVTLVTRWSRRGQPGGSDRPPDIGVEGRRIRLRARAPGLKDAGQGSCALRNDHVTKDRIDGRGAIGAGHDTAPWAAPSVTGCRYSELRRGGSATDCGRRGRAKDSVSVSRLFICRYSPLFSADRPASSDATRGRRRDVLQILDRLPAGRRYSKVLCVNRV